MTLNLIRAALISTAHFIIQSFWYLLGIGTFSGAFSHVNGGKWRVAMQKAPGKQAEWN